MAQLVKNPLQGRSPQCDSWVGTVPWRGDRLPTPAFWPGESHGLYGPRGRKESDTTEAYDVVCGAVRGFSRWLTG